MSWFFLFGFHSYLHGHSHSLFNGTGARCHTSHDIIVRKIESILLFAGQQDVEVEDAGVFKGCIHNHARRQRYAKAMGNGYPVAAFGGRAEVMDVISFDAGGVTHGGTYTANLIALSAARATLEILDER